GLSSRLLKVGRGRRESTAEFQPGLPGYFTRTRAYIRDTREHEKKVGKAVEIDHHQRWDLDLPLKPDHAPLGASTNRAGDVEHGPLTTPAGNNERPQWLELLIALVDGVLETLDALVVDVRLGEVAVHFLQVGGRQERADAEKIALDGDEDLIDAGHRLDSAGHAEGRIEFVDIAVGFDARVVLGDAAAAEKAGIAGVAGFCINLHARNLRRSSGLELQHTTTSQGP